MLNLILPIITPMPQSTTQMHTDFAIQLKKRRLERGWTQQQLAIKSGIKVHNIGAYEEGRAEPRLEKFFKICKAFGINEILKNS